MTRARSPKRSRGINSAREGSETRHPKHQRSSALGVRSINSTRAARWPGQRPGYCSQWMSQRDVLQRDGGGTLHDKSDHDDQSGSAPECHAQAHVSGLMGGER